MLPYKSVRCGQNDGFARPVLDNYNNDHYNYGNDHGDNDLRTRYKNTAYNKGSSAHHKGASARD